MKHSMLPGMLVLLVMLSSCAQKEMINTGATPPQPAQEKTSGAVAVPDLPEPDEIVNGLNAFSFDLARVLDVPERNSFVSPLSISAALAMTYAGAEGKTAGEMQKALHYGPQTQAYHALYGVMLNKLVAPTDDFEITIANAIWVQKKFELLSTYKMIVERDYQSESREMDFVNQPKASQKTINDWVEGKTNQRIKDLIPDGVIDADTRMILTNAVYFNAEWSNYFNEGLTRRDPFYLAGDGQVDCDMMYQREHYLYSNINGTQILELPYNGDEYSMMVLLPEKKDGIDNLIKTVDTSLLAAHRLNRVREDVLIYLPKFKMEAEYELKPALAKLGMEQAFGNDADFSGMTGEKDLKISSVIHKSFIEVDEHKTEAAAATAVVMKMTSMAPSMRTPVEFRADHPFLFLIRHNETGAIVFMGKMADPTKE